MVTVITTRLQARSSSPSRRIWTGVNPVKPSMATTLPFRISDRETTLLSTSSISSFVIYFSLR